MGDLIEGEGLVPAADGERRDVLLGRVPREAPDRLRAANRVALDTGAVADADLPAKMAACQELAVVGPAEGVGGMWVGAETVRGGGKATGRKRDPWDVQCADMAPSPPFFPVLLAGYEE